MKLSDLINRKPIPDPWAEGDNIPWNEPAFSEPMFAEHISQDYEFLLQECGYTNISFYPSLTGAPGPKQRDLLAILATKP